MVQPAGALPVFFGAGKVVGLVVHREPAAANPPVVHLDIFGHAAAKAVFHECTECRDVVRQQV